MKNINKIQKNELLFWVKWSTIIIIIHTIIIGVGFDWDIYSFYPNQFNILGLIGIENHYPRIFDSLTFPVIILVILFTRKNQKDSENFELYWFFIGGIIGSIIFPGKNLEVLLNFGMGAVIFLIPAVLGSALGVGILALLIALVLNCFQIDLILSIVFAITVISIFLGKKLIVPSILVIISKIYTFFKLKECE